MKAADAASSIVGLSTRRIEALSDGVFAIAMTLLILDIRVPQLGSAHGLGAALIALWPKLVSYALSFVMVGVFWVGHHVEFNYVRRADRLSLWINILFLMCVAFVPFSASLLGEYWKSPLAVAVYGVNLMIVASLLWLHWRYATRGRRLVDDDLDQRVIRAGSRRTFASLPAYLLAIALSLADTRLGLLIFIAVPVMYILPGRIDSHWTSPQQTEARTTDG